MRVLSMVAVAGVALAAAGCGSGSGHATSTTAPATTRPASPPTTRPRPKPTATTVFKPTAPQATPDNSATQLVQAWATGNRSLANSVAVPKAVAALFAVPYPGAPQAISRGCSVAFPPIVCTYGPPGGATPTDPLFEIFASQTAAGGWYVSSVTVET